MKLLMLFCCLLAACSLTPAQTKLVKKIAIGGGTALLVGAVAAHGHGNNRPADSHDIPAPSNPCAANPTPCK